MIVRSSFEPQDPASPVARLGTMDPSWLEIIAPLYSMHMGACAKVLNPTPGLAPVLATVAREPEKDEPVFAYVFFRGM